MTTKHHFKYKERGEEKFLLVYVGSHVFKLVYKDLDNDGTAYIPLGTVQQMLAALHEKFGNGVSVYRHTINRKIETLESGY